MTLEEQVSSLIKAYRTFILLDEYKQSCEAKEKASKFRQLVRQFRTLRNDNQWTKMVIVGDINRALMVLQEAIFRGNEQVYLEFLFGHFAHLFPEEFSHIDNHMGIYNFLNPQESNILLQGEVQSGKTMVVVLVSLCYLACNRNVIIVSRNSLHERVQFKDGFERAVNALRSKGITHPNFVFQDDLKKHVHGKIEMLGLIFSDDKLMGRVLEKYGSEIAQTILIADEADLRNERKNHYFVRLQQNVARTMFVSATVQDIMVSDSWNIPSANVLTLFPSRKYRGIDALQIYTDRIESLESKTQYDLDKKKNNFECALCDICIDSEYKEIRPEHPRIVLISVDKRLLGMDVIYNELKPGGKIILPREANDRAVILYNGEGIRFFHTSPLDRVFRNSEINYGKNKSIKDLLLLMAQNGGVERFPNVFIIAFDMASRGINFACYDDLNPRNNWHITHQVLDNRKTCSAVVQALRILGNHNDAIPLKLHTTVECAEKIQKSALLTRQIIHKAKTRFPREFTNRALKQVPIRKSELPKEFLSDGKGKTERNALMVVPDDYKGGENARDKEEEKKEGGGIVSELDREELEYSRQLFEQRANKPNQRITHFLRNIDPERVYSQEEMSQLCKRHNMSLANISKWTSNQVNRIYNNIYSYCKNGNNYGKIIRDNKNGTFQLYPELRDVYKILFVTDLILIKCV